MSLSDKKIIIDNNIIIEILQDVENYHNIDIKKKQKAFTYLVKQGIIFVTDTIYEEYKKQDKKFLEDLKQKNPNFVIEKTKKDIEDANNLMNKYKDNITTKPNANNDFFIVANAKNNELSLLTNDGKPTKTKNAKLANIAHKEGVELIRMSDFMFYFG